MKSCQASCGVFSKNAQDVVVFSVLRNIHKREVYAFPAGIRRLYELLVNSGQGKRRSPFTLHRESELITGRRSTNRKPGFRMYDMGFILKIRETQPEPRLFFCHDLPP